MATDTEIITMRAFTFGEKYVKYKKEKNKPITKSVASQAFLAMSKNTSIPYAMNPMAKTISVFAIIIETKSGMNPLKLRSTMEKKFNAEEIVQ